MKKILAILGISVIMVSGCAGHGSIWEWKYDKDKDEFVLEGVTEFEGRNVRGKTRDGAEMETKSWTLPNMPSTFIGR